MILRKLVNVRYIENVYYLFAVINNNLKALFLSDNINDVYTDHLIFIFWETCYYVVKLTKSKHNVHFVYPNAKLSIWLHTSMKLKKT